MPHRPRLTFLAVWCCLSLTLARSETDSTWVVTEACEPGLLAEDAEESTAHRRRLSGSGSTGPNTGSNTTTNDAHSGAHAHASAQEVGFLTLCIFIGVVTRTWIEPKFFFKLIPYTVILLVVGILIGNLSIWTQLDEGTNDYNKHCHLAPFQTKLPLGCNTTLHACACNSWFDRLNVNILADLSPHVILYVFLPPLIFESAFFMDIHIFVRSFGGILALAVLGVTVATVVTGFFLQYVASEYQHSCINYKPMGNFDTAMMMGAMLSATDPVAVVQLLKSLGASPSLGTLIEGESLLNDGTAYAMFLIFQARSQWHEVATHMQDQACMKGVDLNVTSCSVGVVKNVNGEAIVYTGLNLIILGPIIGYLIGRVAVYTVEFIYNDVIVETTMTVLSAYTSWCVAEYFKSSGVLAVVVTGLCMSHGRGLAFTESAKHFLHEFWEMIGYLLNTMVFIISGTIIGRKWADDSNAVSTRDLTMGMIMYLWVHVARAVALMVAQPFVNKTVCGGRCTSYDFDWRQSVVMWWGGLRGAVGLALGLIVAESPFWDKTLYTGIPEDVKSFYRDGVIFNIGFVAGMTLLVNGVTMGPLVRCLGLNKQGSEIAERNLQRVIDELDRKLRKKIHKLHQDGQKQITDKKVSHLNNKKIRKQQLSTNGRLVTRRGQDGQDGQDGNDGNSKKGNTDTIQEKKKTDTDHAHLNHSEFEHVNWKSVYQYMPVESATVYGRRVRKREIQSWWGTSNLFFFTRWEAEEIGWRRCVGKVLNGIVHNWCGCCFLLPARFSCLNCRGGENDVAIGGNDGCCGCCCGNTALTASSTISMKDKEYNVPIRLQRRWGKYKTEFEGSIVASALKNLPRGHGNGAHRHARGGGRGDPYMHWETTGAKLSSKRILKQSSSHGDGKSQTMNNRLSKSNAPKARNRSRKTTRSRRSSMLLKKGTFAEMADQSIHDAKSYLKDVRASGASESTELESMEQKDLEANDEFLQCRTAEERKSMLNTLLNLGKARAQYCRFVKEKYWHVYEEGLLDKLAFRDLADAEDAMLDMTDRYFITLNHHITPILEKEQEVADAAWKTFKWEEFVISGELKSFSNTLLKLTNVPAVVIFFSQIRCCSWLVRHHLYYFVSRARDIAASYVHANEEVIRHIEHNKLFPSDIAEHIICEAEFQIMAAKDKLHNLDEVFPEIAAHLQTMTATRYLLRQEQSNINKYLRAGEISDKEHEELMSSVLKSLQKVTSHPKPQTLTPQFQKLLMDNDRHKETFGRVIDKLPLKNAVHLLVTLAQGAQMVYLRAGDLVYEQGAIHDHTGHKSMGIYYIARGATTSVWVPGPPSNIRKSRQDRENEYFKELHRIRKVMLQTLISKKRLARSKSNMQSIKLKAAGLRGSSVTSDVGGVESLISTKLNSDTDTDTDEEADKTYENSGRLVPPTRSSLDVARSTGMANVISTKMEKALTKAMFTILSQTTESNATLADDALLNLKRQIPGLDKVMAHFIQKKEQHLEEKAQQDAEETTAEEDYVRTMLAPTKSFIHEMEKHGADLDGDGHITQAEVDIYRQVQLLSTTNEKVDMLDTHLTNHMFGEYEVMAQIKTRQHCVECQGVVIAFYIAPEHMLKLCQDFPCLEEEMWKRSAVTAAKLRLSEPPHDYRHRFTRDLRIAFQNGRVSSPVQRNLLHLDELDEDESEIVELKTEHDHVFFLRTHYRPVNSHHHHYNHVKASTYVSTAENVTSGRAHAIVSGPNNTVRIRNDEVAIIYKLDIRNMKRGNSFHKFPDITVPGLAKGASGVKGSSVARMYGNITKEKTLASRSKAESRDGTGIEKIKEEEEGDDDLGRWHSVGERKEEEEEEAEEKAEKKEEKEGEKEEAVGNAEITSNTETKKEIDLGMLASVKKSVEK